MGKAYQHLSAEERGTIMALRHEGRSLRVIAGVLGRSASTISRELRRNGERPPSTGPVMGRPRLGYDATRAGQRARRLRHGRRRRRKLDRQGLLWAQVRHLLQRKWSPEQIACTLGSVSHQTIYTAIYAIPRGELRRELTVLLRRGRAAQKLMDRPASRRGQMQNLPSIHVRPPEAQDRLLPGHWEGDFLKGGHNRSAVGVLVDRHSLFLMLVVMEDCSALAALKGFKTAFSPLPPEARKTLTYDQGKEMALHRKLAESTGLCIYFADPRSPWQRGICENTNGLLRQYFPKGSDLSKLSQRQLDHIAWEMNTRPRKTLGWKTPAEVFFNKCFEQRDQNNRVALDA
ncbi:IS30 family transposase [Stagnimonas aquatica]|uniref:IS30 family transposase n=1 Tax=Stagnimonas aquatica TaxID=2689987 RepID=A0A3N0UZ10_9GAMM|nr:IS30 family transposase [Stagnimonas aquatica]ROH85592.1 IS30 family transposase [Stagnimonas aquatica]